MVAVAILVAEVVRRRRGLAALGFALALGPACGGGNKYAPPPPPEVTVQQPVEREVTIFADFTGHTVSSGTVDIRARVEGALQSVNFAPGSQVHEGDLLFVIEPTLYEAQLAQAKATLAGKDAQYRAAEQQLEITQAIYQKSAGSRTDLVAKTQARDLAKAEADDARAQLQAAELNLSYTHIYAPFSGIIDRNLVDVGNLVGSGGATVLATLVRFDPMYVYFTMSERELLQYREAQRQGVAGAGDVMDAVSLGLATETGFPHAGRIDYTSNRVDPQTGTIEMRAVFPNADRVLLPGLFARVHVPMSRERARLLPEVAFGLDQGGTFVLVVKDDGKVEYRRIEAGPSIDGEMRVVRKGVELTDWVVVKGLQHARPGNEVKATRAGAEGGAGGSGAAPDAPPGPAGAGAAGGHP